MAHITGHRMRRRQFLWLLATVVLRPTIGAAQQAKIPTIGVLIDDSPGAEEFQQGCARRSATSATSKDGMLSSTCALTKRT